MSHVKYQIFVSSTFKDLKEERNTVIKSILELGHIPVGMEMFSAGDEEQWQLIQRTIDDCDYYVIIMGNKYGSMDGDISYTEKEYDYAVTLGIPTLGFIIDESLDLSHSKYEDDSVRREKLINFKSKVKSKIINYWKNKDELTSQVIIALTKQFLINPRIGWVRASEISDTKVLEEITRLSIENEALRTKIEIPINKDSIDIDQIFNTLSKLYFTCQYSGTYPDSSSYPFSYDQIFKTLRPSFLSGTNLNEIKLNLEDFFRVRLASEGFKRVDKPKIEYEYEIINMLNKILVLNLINNSSSPFTDDKVWNITDLGEEVFRSIIIREINDTIK